MKPDLKFVEKYMQAVLSGLSAARNSLRDNNLEEWSEWLQAAKEDLDELKSYSAGFSEEES